MSTISEWYPILIVGAILGVFATAFIIAFCLMKDKKNAIGFDRHMKDSEIIRRLAVYAKPYLPRFVVIFFIVLASIAFEIISPLFIGEIENIVREEGFELSELYRMIAIYVGVLVVSVAMTYINSILVQKTGQQIISAIRADTFHHIQTLSHEQLNNTPVGVFVTRVTNDTGSISRMFTNVIVNLTKNCILIVAVLGAMLALNYELTLVILCFVPFIVLFTVIFRKFSRAAYRKVKNGTTDLNIFLSENLSGMKVTQIFNQEEEKFRQFTEKNDTLRKARERELFTFSVFRPVIYMLYVSSVLCLFYFGTKGYLDGHTLFGQAIESATIVSFYMYIRSFFNPLQNLAEQFNVLQSAFASAEKIFTIMDIVPAVVDSEDAVDVEHIEGHIEFRDVWFSYLPDEWVLKGVSFEILPGQTAAFVGSTGSGKSTILSLICRNYDIQKGQILIDGKDIKSFRIDSLRSHFGQMLQDVFLFSGTIRSNITLGEEYTDDEINEACRYVNADKFINRLPAGLNEEVRERGNNFSAGQRQLMSFARTVIHKPEVMILDEATANIDTETEILIQESLEKMMNIGTMLIVAHRLSTIQHADVIFVLSHGEIIERGTHFELLEKKGRYHELYMLQYHKERLQTGAAE